jgi:phosphotriesterase-related protein
MELITVAGPVPASEITLADGHAHLWIDPPPGVAQEARIELNRADPIEAELRDFRAAGGSLLVDCQPGGCGRNAAMLLRFAQATGLRVTATTGFHLQHYYPPGHWLWAASAEAAAGHFLRELDEGMDEAAGVRAATIKVGYSGEIAGQSRALMESAAAAAQATGAVILFHTEQGRNVEALLLFFAARGVPPARLYLCHVDKRPDLGLHRELAQAGALLGYDTFVRPKYEPDRNVWPLLLGMVESGLAAHVAICLDAALPSMWKHLGGEPGLLAFMETIRPRLEREGVDAQTAAALLGGNVARFLVRRPPA